MAENQIKTTSSKGLNTNEKPPAHILQPHNGAVYKLEQEQASSSKQSFQRAAAANWETAVSNKNKLKRKKQLSASLTSVGDTVNQEKRTRIEGIQLNCRGKLRSRDTNNFEVAAKTPAKAKVERPMIVGGVTTTNVVGVSPPQRFKRKLQENVDTIHKLNGLTEQLRLEINELKSSLLTERGAVRALRAQNDADSRKWKGDVKKLQHTLELAKKSPQRRANDLAGDAAEGLINYEIQRLTNEIAVLKEANKTKEDKTQINGEAVRRKAADMRELQNAYEIRLTQIQKSAKIEITRLLEEIKTKERNIGQLKKDLLTLQNGKKQNENPQQKLKTTKNKTNETSQKPKKKPTNTTTTTKPKNETNPTHPAQVTNEITQLKNIELINNTKNVHKSLEMRTTKSQTGLMPPTLKELSNRHEQIMTSDGTVNTWMTSTTSSNCHSLPQDVVCALLHKSTGQTQTHDAQEYRPKDHNSDTDSALSSAPPSISPQPPSSGSDSGVMWQTMHSYSKDLEKLQKDVELYHKENERLQSELQLMKQELLAAEQAARTANNNTHINELLERINELEEQQQQLTTEADELREQNELLEFRILELEDDKMDGNCEAQCQRLQNLLQQSTLDENDRRCLQQLVMCVQQLELQSMEQQSEQSSLETTTKSEQRLSRAANNPAHNRIVATVQPYNNSAPPTATPQESPRKLRHAWQSSSLSESGVFVECDFAGEPSIGSWNQSTGTQTECSEQELEVGTVVSKRLQYYKERLALLEGKVLVYESSGETQAKHLADRLQREIQLEKQLRELSSRVECLAQDNLLLEEEKCEFEEAENDTRLGLQRLEVELEILRQRNVELEFSKDALSAKYKDCRTECIILRDDLCAFETQIQNLESDRQSAKQQLASIRRSLPLLLICRLLSLAKSINMGNDLSAERESQRESQRESPRESQRESQSESQTPRAPAGACYCPPTAQPGQAMDFNDSATARELSYLKEEVKSLRGQMKDLNSRHYEAMETADSHWVDLEREYKEREEAYRCKEINLKQKINKLQDCIREDSRAAAEKIQQLEDGEQGLKTSLVRLTKEYRDLMEQHRALENHCECDRAKREREAEEQLPLTEALEFEKRRSQALIDDLSFSKKLQRNTEDQLKLETDTLRQQIFDMKKEFMHIEVTNGELKEEVRTLESKIREMENQLKCAGEMEMTLEDELRTKEELIQGMERKLGVCPEGFSLADELYDSPAKRAKRAEINDLEAASQGLGCALRDLERREKELPTHRDFQTIACSVKQLADTLLFAQNQPEEVSACLCQSQQDLAAKPGQGESGPSEAEQAPAASSQDTGKRASVSSQKSRKSQGGKGSSKDDKPRSTGGGVIGVGGGGTLTVGMALLPQVGFTVGQLPTLDVSKEKKQICEVPSELRKLAVPSTGGQEQQSEAAASEVDLRRKRRVCKRFIYRRIFRGRVRRIGAMGKDCFFDVPDLDQYPSEVLQRSISYSSFHSVASIHSVRSALSRLSMRSQHATVLDQQQERFAAHAIVQTEQEAECKMVQAVPLMCDRETEAVPEMLDCGIQAEDACVEHRLRLLSVRTRGFLELLQQNISQSDFNCATFRARLLHLWESSEEFREHIELLQDLCTDSPRLHSWDQLDGYDKFVAILECVRAMKLALKPGISPVLNGIEEKVNGRLIKFHNRKVESEFYCTIYYPVERRNTMNLTID